MFDSREEEQRIIHEYIERGVVELGRALRVSEEKMRARGIPEMLIQVASTRAMLNLIATYFIGRVCAVDLFEHEGGAHVHELLGSLDHVVREYGAKVVAELEDQAQSD